MIVPDKASKLSKKAQVAGMFDRIAGKYDFLNHFLSLHIDKGWRRKAILEVMAVQPQKILDVATGTGDMAITAVKAGAPFVVGVDISEGMLAIGKKKIESPELKDKIKLQTGDSEDLQFETATFDAVMCAYGVRNFEDLEAGLKEMRRVLRPEGKVVILEFSKPKAFPIKQFYGLYSKYLVPFFGRFFSNDKSAYAYLPESVAAFPEGQHFVSILKKCGFKQAKARPLTFGISTLYTAVKGKGED